MNVTQIQTNFFEFLNEHKYIVDTQNFNNISPNSIVPINKISEETYLSTATSIGDYDIIVNDATGIIPGRYVIMFNSDIGNAYCGFVLSVASNTLTMNVPVNAEYPAGTATIVDSTIIDMSVNGSLTPVVYRRRGDDPGNLPEDLICTRMSFAIETATLPEYNDFGDIAGGLTKGLVIRQVNGSERHVVTIRNNAELAAYCGPGDFTILDATNPAQGINGISAMLDFSKMGTAIRMEDTGDIKITVQDDLSSLDQFIILCEGYFKYRGV